MFPCTGPIQDDPLQDAWKVIDLKEVDIDFPEESGSVLPSFMSSDGSDVDIDFPEGSSSVLSFGPEFHKKKTTGVHTVSIATQQHGQRGHFTAHLKPINMRICLASTTSIA